LHRLSEGLVALLSDFDEVRMEREQDELPIDTRNRLDMRSASQMSAVR
jgi:hypothetical protein